VRESASSIQPASAQGFFNATRVLLLALLALISSPPSLRAADEIIALDGTWRFQLDRADAGVGENWSAKKLAGRIRLPGSLPEQGIGDAPTTNTLWTGGIEDKSFFTAPEFEKYRQPGNVKLPFWLTPETYYAGAAWFQREFKIPADWSGRIGRRVSGWTERFSARMIP
jgi:hypothetical protein